MPDVLQNRSPRCNTNTSTDKDCDFIVKHVLSRGTIGAIDAERWHVLAILECHLVDTRRINTVIQLGLSASGTNGITQCPCEVTDLSNMHGDIRVIRAGCDSKWMPLEA
jgi:hypothetical protein